MQETEKSREMPSRLPHVRRNPLFRRIALCAGALLALLLLALVPPLISVNRLQRRIARSIGDSLGRPVHLDRVTLNLLPFPGFTLENFVVGEDPAFGWEPVIQANTVSVRLRIRSLWRRQVEFSNISFTDPSVNIVRNAQGQWNLSSILVQASHVNAAPTEQRHPGPAPRFPYIEATGARLNLKMGDEKMPLSLTDAKFALWLNNPEEWRVELEAHPARTDTNATDTGTLKVEGTLKRAASFAEVPIALTAEWRKAPLGEASLVVMGGDTGWRGLLNLSADIAGTLGEARLTTHAQLRDFRRADFVPAQSLDLDAQCQAKTSFVAGWLRDVQCALPVGDANAIPLRRIALTGDVPDVHHPRTAQLQIGVENVPAAWFVDWARLFSQRLPQTLAPAGDVNGSFTRDGTRWAGGLKSALTVNAVGDTPMSLDASMLMGAAPPGAQPAKRGGGPIAPVSSGLVLQPSPLRLGKNTLTTLTGDFNASRYTLHLSGTAAPARLMLLGQMVPPAVDSLDTIFGTIPSPAPQKIDITCTRNWGGPQTCQAATAPEPGRKRHR